MRRLAAVSATVLLLMMSGCGDGAPDTPTTETPLTADGVVEPTGTAGLPSGIVTSRTDHGSDTTVVTVNWPARTVAVKQVAPPSETRLKSQVLIGPDGRTVAIHDSTGWYTTRMDATSPPVRQPLSDQANLANIPFAGRVLF